MSFAPTNAVQKTDIAAIIKEYIGHPAPLVGEAIRVPNADDETMLHEYVFTKVGKKNSWVFSSIVTAEVEDEEEDEEIEEEDEEIEEIEEVIVEVVAPKKTPVKKEAKKKAKKEEKRDEKEVIDEAIAFLNDGNIDDALALLKAHQKMSPVKKGKAVKKDKADKADKAVKPPRKKNIYNVFISYKMALIKQDDPTLKSGERMAMAVVAYQKLSDDEKAEFKSEHMEDENNAAAGDA